MAQATTRARNHHPLPRAGVAALQPRVNGDTRTEHGRRLLRLQPIRDRGDVIRRSEGVLLECARGVVAGDALAEAEAVRAGLTGLTVSAGTGDPFDADSVADFEAGGVGAGAEFGDFARAFVAAYLAWLGWEGEETPLFFFFFFINTMQWF